MTTSQLSPNVSSVIIDFLKDLRHSTLICKTRKTWIDIPAGVSVTSSDFPDNQQSSKPSTSCRDTSERGSKTKTLNKATKKKKLEELESDLESIDSFKSDKSDDQLFALEAIIQSEDEDKDLEIKPPAWVFVSNATKIQKNHFLVKCYPLET